MARTLKYRSVTRITRETMASALAAHVENLEGNSEPEAQAEVARLSILLTTWHDELELNA